MRNLTFVVSIAVAAASWLLMPANASAQAFADVANALVDYSKAEHKPRRACDTMGRFKSDEIRSIKADMIVASEAVPAYCKVTGTLKPEIAFEVSLPAQWNGRFYMIGNGGFAGDNLDNPGRAAQRNEALRLGFAFAQTNTGHDAQQEPGASFVMSDPQKAIDYAYRAVHLTAVTGKAVTKDYYGGSASRSYWNSCSNGGRQGLIEAQRYPDDFDGVLANAPWVEQTGFVMGAMWNQRAISQAPLTPAKLAFVAGKVMDKCDQIDGLKDGLIDDPRKCAFDPVRDVPACSQGTDGADCLTPAQAEAMAKVYGGPVSSGRPLFPGFMPGSEAVMPGLFGGGTGSGWMNVIVPAKPDAKPADFNLAENAMRYLVHTPPRPDYDYTTFDFDKDAVLLEAWGKLANANNPDLSKFRRRGGKVLMTYGWADAVLQPLMGVNYYERAISTNGPDTRDFFRLFMVPGMAHCAGGIGPDRHDAMTALINWVEKGKAPDAIVASKVTDGKVVRTRPLCAYPQVARYSGQGSIDDAASFGCVAP